VANVGYTDVYFKYESVEAITNHILSLYAGKIAAFSRADGRVEVRLDREEEGTVTLAIKLKFHS
jgi:glutamate dehydrogenase